MDLPHTWPCRVYHPSSMGTPRAPTLQTPRRRGDEEPTPPRSWRIKGGNDLENGKRLTGRSVCSQPGPGGQTHAARPPLQRRTGVKRAPRPALGTPQPKVPMKLPPGGCGPSSAPGPAQPSTWPWKSVRAARVPTGPDHPGDGARLTPHTGSERREATPPGLPAVRRPGGGGWAVGTGPAQHDALPAARPSSQAGVEVASSGRDFLAGKTSPEPEQS